MTAATAVTTASALLEALRSTLQSEQSALVRGEADALPALADAKAQAFEQISRAMRGAWRRGWPPSSTCSTLT